MKKYKTGLVLGRFQTFHKGHEYIINKALEICDKVLVFIGSSDKFGTIENPFSYELREKLIKKIYENEIVENKLVISPLADLGAGNVTKWGDYLFCEAEKIYQTFKDKVKISFGIGTFVTNDTKEKPLNIVIKLQYVNGRPVAKLSDVEGKVMCDDEKYLKYLKASVKFRLEREKEY